ITLPDHKMNLGRGGIREIEFFPQTRQLIAGGRDPDLRPRDTVTALARLADKGWVPQDTAQSLTDHYGFARMVEHRLQMDRDAQTHTLPKTEEGFQRLAAMMDTTVTDLRATLVERLSAVHSQTEGFFAPEAASEAPPTRLDDAMQSRWRSYPALRSARGAALFDRIEPQLIARLGAATKPQEALAAFDGFLAGLPAGVQLVSLFDANPHLVDLLVDIVATSPALAQYLSRNAGVLDAVIGGRFFAPWPGLDALCARATAVLDGEDDYEAQLDAIRVWAKEWHFRVGVHHLRNLVTAEEAGQQYCQLARAVVSALWPAVQRQFAVRHGPAPGRGAVILGMGSLGAGTLTPQSDLDLIVVYDAEIEDVSDGPRPLTSRAYYARLTQAMITALTAQTAQGRLYEVDMRLRPSGNQGPVATSWASYQRYQREDAWLWEHLALVRAQVIAGSDTLGHDVETLRAEVLGRPRDRDAVMAELADMRRRIAAAKSSASAWDAKTGEGRLQDIELLSQAGAVLTGETQRSVGAGMAACVTAKLLSPVEAGNLTDTHALLWRLQMAARLLSTTPVSAHDLGASGQDFLLRAVGKSSLAKAETYLVDLIAQAADIIDRAVHGSESADAKR
ncbi:MAG: glutamine-synthetase adenylyltransferase, partial [Tateyamaria sp.]